MSSKIPRFCAVAMGIVIVLAFLAQSMIPAGFMPAFGTGKFFEITICHGADQTRILVYENMQPVKDGGSGNKKIPSSDQSKPCIFASVSSKDLAIQAFVLHQAELLTYEEAVVREGHRAPSAKVFTAYYSQGPPHFLLQI